MRHEVLAADAQRKLNSMGEAGIKADIRHLGFLLPNSGELEIVLRRTELHRVDVDPARF